MPSINVNVKWGKEKHSLEANTDEEPALFKAQLFAVTGVQPDRQKILFKGKTLTDDSWDGFPVLKAGALLMMLGSADSVPEAPKKKTLFLEDMNDAQMARALDMPVGLKNLGNTCYMNATLQCLKTVPEFAQALKSFRGDLSSAMSGLAGAPNTSEAITAAVRDLYTSMDTTGRQSGEIIPLIMLQVLHMCFPHFAEKDDHGHLQQQDANECWIELMRMFQQRLPPLPLPDQPAEQVSTTRNLISQHFGGSFQTKLVCAEEGVSQEQEPPTEQSESFLSLSCFIQAPEVKYLHSGLRAKLTEEITKHSPTLDRDAKYKKETLITRLPSYLTINIVRFEYKERSQVNAKVLKDVKFPLILDVFDLCTSDLQQKLMPMRGKMKEESDRELELQKKIKQGEASAEEKKDKIKLPHYFEEDYGSNNSGFYELQAVLTHKGRSSNSGHYVAWVRRGADEWIKCDDDIITRLNSEEVLKLSGGGDWHCAYLLLYGPKILEIDPKVDTQKDPKVDTQKDPKVDTQKDPKVDTQNGKVESEPMEQ